MKFETETFLKGKNIFSAFRDKELLFHPSREWIIGLFFSTFFFVIGVSLICLDFYNQFYVIEFDIQQPTQIVEYNAKEVHSYAEKYNEKEKAFNALRGNRVPVPVVVPEVVPVATTDTVTPVEADALADVVLGQ